MSIGEIFSKIEQFATTATAQIGEFNRVHESAKSLILEHFGQNGLYAAYFLAAALVMYLLIKLAKMTWATMKYLVFPALALAFIGSLVVPYSFAALLPLTVTACSLVLLFKG